VPFTEEDATLFCGRDAEIAAFVERIRHEPVLAVVGPSGAGKTSFVRAGVIARLLEQGSWTVVQLRPGRRPFSLLAHRLRHGEGRAAGPTSLGPPSLGDAEARSSRPGWGPASGPGEGPPSHPGEVEELAARLAERPAELGAHLRVIDEARDTRVLLVVDQLEELFTLTSDERAQARFMEAICTAVDDAAEPVRVVITVRDDFLGRLATGPEARLALRAVTVLGRPNADMLEQALVAPLAAVGYRYEDPALPALMASAVAHEPAALPLLQFAAHKLWEQRDPERKLLLRSAYEAMGGVDGASVPTARTSSPPAPTAACTCGSWTARRSPARRRSSSASTWRASAPTAACSRSAARAAC
jgi:hypothetical protein